MTLLQQLEIIFNNELVEIIEHEMMAETIQSPDRDLTVRYQCLVKKHKDLLNMVMTLVDGVIDRSEEALNNRAIMEQNYYSLRKKDFELKYMCAYDSLTEVYSRRFILQAAEKELFRSNKNHKPFVVAMVDLDDFKTINDTQGHPAGDRVLNTMAQTMKCSLRPEDLVGRYGGDEFLLILPDTSEETGREVLKRLCKTIKEVEVPGMPRGFSISASFGCCAYDCTETMDRHELIYCADQALLRAKRFGKNNVEVYEHAGLAV